MSELTQLLVNTSEAVHQASGKHLLLTLKGCPAEYLDDETKLVALARAAAEATHATVLQMCSHRFSPQGVTVIAVLAESHASLHTYPESNTLFWDCFTCGETCDPELGIAVLEKALQPTSISRQLIPRS